MGLNTFGTHPALLGGHHPYADMGLQGMGHMGMPGRQLASVWSGTLCLLSRPAHGGCGG
jgi:hypothetical protein